MLYFIVVLFLDFITVIHMHTLADKNKLIVDTNTGGDDVCFKNDFMSKADVLN